MEAIDSLAGKVRRLEEEHEQLRAVLTRLAQQVEHFHAPVADFSERMQAVEKSQAAISGPLTRLSRLEEDVRQAKDQIDRFHTITDDERQKQAEAERRRASEMDKDRQSLGEMARRMDTQGKDVDAIGARMQAAEEMVRRNSDAAADGYRRIDELARQAEALEGRVLLGGERHRQAEEEFSRLEQELDTMRKQDDVALSRLQILLEQVKKIGDQSATLQLLEKSTEELTNRLEVHRLERQRIEQGLARLEEVLDEHRRRLDEQGQLMAHMEGRTRNGSDRVAEMSRILEEHRQETAAQLAQFAEINEEHKRREIAELAQQIRELRQRGPSPAGS